MAKPQIFFNPKLFLNPSTILTPELFKHQNFFNPKILKPDIPNNVYPIRIHDKSIKLKMLLDFSASEIQKHRAMILGLLVSFFDHKKALNEDR